jgi:predicted MFS family arabinose efflux permease
VSINSQAVSIESALAEPTMSRFHAMFSVGGMIGASLGGLIAWHGVEPRAHLAIASALFLLIALFTAPLLLDAHDHTPKRSGRLALKRIPPVLLTLTAIGFCMFLSEGAMADWTAVYRSRFWLPDRE